ncbi:MAG: LamG domain-containing protein, partial [Phycisphaerae bacterium]|nr:LamG domain-containing protein [Phycisphaerae bacterium]
MNAMKRAMVMAAVVSVFALSGYAETVGYWRFEGDATGFVNDSGSNNFDLGKSSTAPTQYTLPSSGAGSKFDDPIPGSGAANAKAANLSTSRNRYFYRADAAAFNVTSFTVEAYIRRSTTSSGFQCIASQYKPSGGQRSWYLCVFGTGSGSETNQLSLVWTSDGGFGTAGYEKVYSGIVINEDTDYFIAMSFDAGDTVAGVKFYVKNLETGVWQTATKGHKGGSPYNSTGQFRIGAIDYSTLYGWTGLIDEVRLSNVALRPTQLLNGLHDVIGYWRFEGDATGFVTDVGPNDFTLSTSSTAPTQYTLPSSGSGSKFDDPIMQNNLPNAKAANFGSGSNRCFY